MVYAGNHQLDEASLFPFLALRGSNTESLVLVNMQW